MAFLTFEPRHQLGHPEIDAQHASLFDAVNRLAEAVDSGVGRLALGKQLAQVREEAVQHFRLEEDLMERAAYPGLPGHKHLHDELMKQASELEAQHKLGLLTLSASVMNFLKDWLAHHISVEDRRLAEFLSARGA